MHTNRRDFLQLGAVAASLATGPALAVGPTLAAIPPRAPLRILVLGGTRYLGPAVVRAGLARGHDLTLFNRGRTRPDLFPGVPRIRGNRFPERDGGLSGLASGQWDVVIDLCAYYPRLVEASVALLRPRVGHYLMVSSISVYGGLDRPGLDEDAPLRALAMPYEELPDLAENGWPSYGARKAAGEAIVARAFGERSTLVRPCSICGGENNDGSGAYWAARLHGGGRVLAPGDGSDPVQIVDVGDVADFTLLAAEQRLGGAWNLVGPAEPLTLRDYLAAAARVTGGRGEIFWKGDYPSEMRVPIAAPFALVPGFATMSNRRARAAGLRFRPLEDTIRTNWVDHRARRGDAHDFAAEGVGLPRAREAELLGAIG